MIVTGNTAVYGVIGDPIAHTLSPPMQNRAMEAMGFDAVYLPFRVATDELERAIGGMRALSIRGLNVTVPHKSAVIPFLDRLTESAEVVGAVNTILLNGRPGNKGRLTESPLLIGENTDGYGFLKCIEEAGVAVFPERVCILGAGGAARSVVYACATRPEVREIAVVNRTLFRARDLAEHFSRMISTRIDLSGRPGGSPVRITAHPSDPEEMRRILPDAGMIVNTTTVGMSPDIDHSPVPDPVVFHPGQVVCDIIYTPLHTRFLREAEQHGSRTIGGLPMLAWQGARSLSLWTGREAPADVMLDELKKWIEMN